VRRPLAQQTELVLSLAKRDLKARYKDSVLGFLWSLFRPAFLSLILWFVFSKILGYWRHTAGVPYWLHVLASVLVWNFFVGTLFESTASLVSNASLIKKVHLNAEVFPISAIVSNAVHFALAFALLLVVVLLAGVGLHWHILLLPVVLLVLVLLMLGLGFWLSALNVYYRDVGSVVELTTMAWFYITPIIYPLYEARTKLLGISKFGSVWFGLYMLNPMAPIVVAFRALVLQPPGQAELPLPMLAGYLGQALVLSLAVAITGWLAFRRLSWRFADEL
jgi:ABC-type polysaccharide/polyol phosphate export permease